MLEAMKRAARMLDLLIPAGFAITLVWVAPLGTAFQFGGDEGYELMKGFLSSEGYPLYQSIWNDQPPLHTAILSALFGWFGPSALVARMLTVGFATVLVAVFFRMVRQRSGWAAALLAVLVLVSSPSFLQLSVSVMIELPAMSLALAGVLALFAYFKSRRMFWLVLSGMIFACALQTKLTAAIFLPALFVEWAAWAARKTGAKESNKPDVRMYWNVTKPLFMWFVTIAATFGFIALLFPGESVDLLWRSHRLAEAKIDADTPDRHGFDKGLLLRDYDAFIPAIFGVLILLVRRRWDLLFPAVLFTTVYFIHLVHRPYWYYYYLHFSIPMAWLAAIGVQELFSILWRFELTDLRRPPFKPVWVSLLWSAALSLIVAGLPERFRRGIAKISYADSARENAIVRQLEEYRDRTKWVYTDRVIYAFHAGLPVPPELAIIPAKRIWSGQITPEGIVAKLEEYRPEQIVLIGSKVRSPALAEFIENQYLGIGLSGEHRHFVANRVLNKRESASSAEGKSGNSNESHTQGKK